MLLLYHSHKHISYPIRTIARSAINSYLLMYITTDFINLNLKLLIVKYEI
ncbi:hypothetical protein [Wolbachia endosymbiont (group A) of Nomada hirtipes]